MPKTMFMQGFASVSFRPLPFEFGSSLGQGLASSLSQSSVTEQDRNAMLAKLAAAADKFAIVNSWSQAHPNDADTTLLGADAARYRELMGNLQTAGWGHSSATLTQTLASMDPAVWAQAPATDWNASENWIAAVNELATIVQRHTPIGAAPLIAPRTAPAASTGISPLIVGIGAAALVGLAVIVLT